MGGNWEPGRSRSAARADSDSLTYCKDAVAFKLRVEQAIGRPPLGTRTLLPPRRGQAGRSGGRGSEASLSNLARAVASE